MREVQPTVLRPAWSKFGWWSGLFNLLGAIGFFLCAGFGFESAFDHPMLSELAIFLGSACFLTASYLMLLEAINPRLPEGRSKTTGSCAWVQGGICFARPSGRLPSKRRSVAVAVRGTIWG